MKKIDIEQPRYVYHVGKKGYDVIKPGGMVRTPEERKKFQEKYPAMTDNEMDIYDYEINAFLGPVTKEMVLLLKNNGFINWNVDELYLYKINVTDPANKSIEYFRVTSTPEQMEYDKKHWDKMYFKYKYLTDEDFEKVKNEFIKDKQNYMLKRAKYLKQFNTDTELTLAQFLNINKKRYADWCDTEKYFKLNAMYGSKKQYATYIPHVQMYTKKALKFESSTKIF